jgi:hypothetical protein
MSTLPIPTSSLLSSSRAAQTVARSLPKAMIHEALALVCIAPRGALGRSTREGVAGKYEQPAMCLEQSKYQHTLN